MGGARAPGNEAALNRPLWGRDQALSPPHSQLAELRSEFACTSGVHIRWQGRKDDLVGQDRSRPGRRTAASTYCLDRVKKILDDSLSSTQLHGIKAAPVRPDGVCGTARRSLLSFSCISTLPSSPLQASKHGSKRSESIKAWRSASVTSTTSHSFSFTMAWNSLRVDVVKSTPPSCDQGEAKAHLQQVNDTDQSPAGASPRLPA